MTDIISSDHPLSSEQQKILSALLDTVIPCSDDGSMPSAADLDLVAWLTTNVAEFLPVLPAILAHFYLDFTGLSLKQRVEAVTAFSQTEPELFNAFLFQVYCCYYEDDRVLVGIGSAAGAPFPRGNTVPDGDLSLLDAVTNLGKQYRPVE